jgi:hypothetical protein
MQMSYSGRATISFRHSLTAAKPAHIAPNAAVAVQQSAIALITSGVTPAVYLRRLSRPPGRCRRFRQRLAIAVVSPAAERRFGPAKYPARVRILKRLVIRLRWPAVAAAGLCVAIAAMSLLGDWGCRLPSRESTWFVAVKATVIEVIWESEVLQDDLEFGPQWGPDVWTGWATRQYLLPSARPGVLGDGWTVTCPLWILALPPALLSFVGFRFKRRESTPGQCQRCRHPLAGAAVCPECGEPAPAAAA